MNPEHRKRLFVSLLEKMLSKCDGIKGQLAKQLQIAPSTLSYWLQGKIDPGELSINTFNKIAKVTKLPVDTLANQLGFFEDNSDQSLDKFRQILKELLKTNSQDELAAKIGISQAAISKWLDSEKKFDLDKISAIRMSAIAKVQGWTIERLLTYLNLTQPEAGSNLFFKLQSSADILSLNDQVKLLIWLTDRVQEKLIEQKNINTFISDRTICIILETEDLTIASNYASNLAIHLNVKPENIKVTTIPKLPESIADIDILIFDISTPSSASIALIEDIEFDRDIVVFVDPDLPSGVRSSLENKFTDLVVKPIDWQKLKDKAYFS